MMDGWMNEWMNGCDGLMGLFTNSTPLHSTPLRKSRGKRVWGGFFYILWLFSCGMMKRKRVSMMNGWTG